MQNEQVLTIEMPSGVNKSDLWHLEEELRQIEGLEKVSLNQPKDIGGTIVLIIAALPLATTYVKQGVSALANIKEAAKKLHEFLHPKEKKQLQDEEARKKIVVKQADGSQLEIYGYSVDELTTLLTKTLPASKE